jgi:lyso-ornithine lipid O-acyltransferase
MRRVCKILLIVFIITAFSALFGLLHFFLLPRSRAFHLSRLSYFSSILIRKILGIKVLRNGSIPSATGRVGFFFVCNHLSYLDGVILNSMFPILFIGRGDLKDWPLLGIFTRLSGTIFVNRNSAAHIHADISRIESVLKSGVNVMLFPEGTTTDGNKTLPFKSSFFQAPIACRSPIVPLSISYLTINGSPVTQENKDNIYWYSETGFFVHVLRVLALRSIEVEITISEPVNLVESQDRKAVRTLLQKTIEENLRMISVQRVPENTVSDCL